MTRTPFFPPIRSDYRTLLPRRRRRTASTMTTTTTPTGTRTPPPPPPALWQTPSGAPLRRSPRSLPRPRRPRTLLRQRRRLRPRPRRAQRRHKEPLLRGEPPPLQQAQKHICEEETGLVSRNVWLSFGYNL